MDDLDSFISSQVRGFANQKHDGCIPRLRRYRSAVTLCHTNSKVAEQFPIYVPPRLTPVTWLRTHLSQSSYESEESHWRRQTLSQWHRALEKSEERRKWRRTAAELSIVFSRWLKRGMIQDDNNVRAPAEVQPPIHPLSTSHIRIKVATTIPQHGLDINEEPEQLDEVTLIECNACDADTITNEVLHEKAQRRLKDSPVPIWSSKRDEADTIALVLVPEPTPISPESPSTLSTPSSTTPSSKRLKRSLEDTPDTPESLLRPLRSGKERSLPESPTPKPPRSDGRAAGSLKPPGEFEYPRLDDDVFNYRDSSHPQHHVYRPLFRRSISANGLLDAQPAATRRVTRPQTRAWHAPPGAQIETALSSKDGIERESSTIKEETASIKLLQLGVKHEVKDSSFRPRSLPEESAPSIGTRTPQSPQPPKNPVPSVLVSIESSSSKSEKKIFLPATPKLANALELYNQLTNSCTWTRFRTDHMICFGNTKLGQRCRKRCAKSDRDLIEEAINDLEALSLDTKFESYSNTIQAFINLSFCERKASGKSSRKEWGGHKAGFQTIILAFQKAVGSPVPPITYTQQMVGFQKIVHTASRLPQTIIITGKIPYSAAMEYAGLEQWQPKIMVGKRVESCLLELIKTPLNNKRDTVSGKIYAYRSDGVFGYYKIGYTTQEIEERLIRWERQCKHKPAPALGSLGKLPHVFRVEKLIHTSLKEFRHIQTHCSCGRKHKEWFAVPDGVVRALVQHWSAWMLSEPYDEEGLLKPLQLKELEQDIPRLAVIAAGAATGSSTANALVKGLEAGFEFLLA